MVESDYYASYQRKLYGRSMNVSGLSDERFAYIASIYAGHRGVNYDGMPTRLEIGQFARDLLLPLNVSVREGDLQASRISKLPLVAAVHHVIATLEQRVIN